MKKGRLCTKRPQNDMKCNLAVRGDPQDKLSSFTEKL